VNGSLRRAWVALALAAAVVPIACGGTGKGTTTAAGIYLLDVDRTFPAGTSTGGALRVNGARGLALTKERLGPEAYRLELKSDQTFTLRVGSSGEPTVLTGSWTEGETGVTVSTKSVDGVAPPAGESTDSFLSFDAGGDGLVVNDGGSAVYLKRM
jgi:hypothetical protein